MKLGYVVSFVLAISPLFTEAGSVRRDITITEVGLSQNSNRVFVKSSDRATDSNCSDKEHYAMELGSPESYLFYSAGLTAMNESKKMRVIYITDGECMGDAPRVDVFWNLNY